MKKVPKLARRGSEAFLSKNSRILDFFEFQAGHLVARPASLHAADEIALGNSFRGVEGASESRGMDHAMWEYGTPNREA
jgi:hypothetical protein